VEGLERRMRTNRRTRPHAGGLLLLVVSVLSPAVARSAGVSDIQFSYKRDPRVVDPYRGLGPWAVGPGYSGATAQDKVETRARAVDAKGEPIAATPEWTPSDPEMVTISPSKGDHVTIAVHRPGESRVRIAARGFSKELTVKARYEGKYLVFEIAPPAPPKPVARELSAELQGKEEQVSYAVGMNLARTLQKQSVKVDPELVRRGFKDVLAGGPTLMTDDQAHNALIGVETQINLTDAGLARKRLAEKNGKEGREFLARNGKKKGVVTLPSGLQYKVLKAGDGKKPTLEDVAVCHYRGMFLDGTEFDSSYRRKTHEPVPFPVKGIIRGWQEALQRMPAGSKWQLFVPPKLAYGERGAPRSRIGPDSTLIFEIDLLSVEPPGARQQVARARSKSPTAEVTPEMLEQLKKAVGGEPTTGPVPEAKESHP
jgi:FKBP-type peptidyl-prolyl cis-trans isomerase FklB